jgi:hypothetical protein
MGDLILMDQALFYDLQEALLIVFYPVLSWFCVLVVAGGVFAGILAFAMELGASRSGDKS